MEHSTEKEPVGLLNQDEDEEGERSGPKNFEFPLFGGVDLDFSLHF